MNEAIKSGPSSSPVELDTNDPLSHFRDQFFFPSTSSGERAIYLCGNSLGLQPKNVPVYVQEHLKDWATYGVEGHMHGRLPWLPYHELVTDDLASLTGGMPHEVVAMNSLTVNLHLMLTSFYRPTATRHKILLGYSPFPSDRYAVESQIKLHGRDPKTSLVLLTPREGEAFMRIEDIARTIDAHRAELSLVLIEGVNYYSGQAVPLAEIAGLARRAGALCGADLAHTIGNLPLKLHDWGIDFAVWCSYKYLNGGPGCIGGCFVHERHGYDPTIPRCAGWWGHDKQSRFKMGPDFNPIKGVEGWQLSNPPILPLASLRASLEIFREATITALRAKSIALTGYLETLLVQEASNIAQVITPPGSENRGCQLSLRISGGKKVFNSLIAHGVFCDWREPDVIRIAPTPLYNSFQDVHHFVEILKKEATA